MNYQIEDADYEQIVSKSIEPEYFFNTDKTNYEIDSYELNFADSAERDLKYENNTFYTSH